MAWLGLWLLYNHSNSKFETSKYFVPKFHLNFTTMENLLLIKLICQSWQATKITNLEQNVISVPVIFWEAADGVTGRSNTDWEESSAGVMTIPASDLAPLDVDETTEDVLDCLEWCLLLTGVLNRLLPSPLSLLFKKSNKASSVFFFLMGTTEVGFEGPFDWLRAGVLTKEDDGSVSPLRWWRRAGTLWEGLKDLLSTLSTVDSISVGSGGGGGFSLTSSACKASAAVLSRRLSRSSALPVTAVNQDMVWPGVQPTQDKSTKSSHEQISVMIKVLKLVLSELFHCILWNLIKTWKY